MKIKVNLDDIITGMELQMDEMSSYLNKETGEVSTVMEQEFRYVEEEDDSLISLYGLVEEGIEKARDILMDDEGIKYIALPSKFEINEWEIMKQFCLSVDDKNISQSLMDAIHGRGAFRYFKDSIQRYGIDDQWYKFRGDAIKKIAIEWCETNDIEYTEK